MDKKLSAKKCDDEQSACEIIELAISDLNTLADAFNTISAYCLSLDEDADLPSGIPDHHLH